MNDPIEQVDEAANRLAVGVTTFPRPFGSYLLLQLLARGGMGEVYLAKQGGIAGIEKYCVVKTLRPHFTMDREYVTRFMDEARVVVHLTHRNICQVFDVGKVRQKYYLAMEHIVGRDLRSLLQDPRVEGRFTQAMLLHIACEVLEALDYAHRLRDPASGDMLKLVHRDVSPQNIMLNYEGEVKLIDFGLAASSKKEEKTQPNVVMGKMAYMAPEQARGDSVDGRADLFAVAVLTYEMLVGERFYEGMSFDDMWSVAGRGGFRPRKWDTLDANLRLLLERGLATDLELRFQTCGDFKDALSNYLFQNQMRASAREMRAVMEGAFADEMQEVRNLLSQYANVRMGPGTGDLASVPVTDPSSVVDERTQTGTAPHSLGGGLPLGDDDSAPAAVAPPVAGAFEPRATLTDTQRAAIGPDIARENTVILRDFASAAGPVATSVRGVSPVLKAVLAAIIVLLAGLAVTLFVTQENNRQANAKPASEPSTSPATSSAKGPASPVAVVVKPNPIAIGVKPEPVVVEPPVVEPEVAETSSSSSTSAATGGVAPTARKGRTQRRRVRRGRTRSLNVVPVAKAEPKPEANPKPKSEPKPVEVKRPPWPTTLQSQIRHIDKYCRKLKEPSCGVVPRLRVFKKTYAAMEIAELKLIRNRISVCKLVCD